MFKRALNKKGEVYLQYTDKPPGERGYWSEIGHITNKGMKDIIRANEEMGYEVLIDEQGYYRVLVNKE